MSASPDRMVAGLIGDRYEITGLIASGGMGAVYRARDQVLDRTVAVKVLKNGGDDPEFVAKFKSEATNAARLSHPNIVQVFDFGYENGQPYMAMEFVDGQNLREILTTRHVLRPDVAARIALQVASALEHARRNGLMHRDIKPENILITTDGVVKVADFGLSRALAESRATQANVLMGTAAYLAPEQVQGETIDHRADIYALGIVLFEMLTGKLPFGGDSPVVVAYKRVAEDVPSAMSINPGVPRELDMIVARATGRAASSRFATAGQMVEALREQAPRSDTGDIGGLVHHTQAIPIMGEQTIAVERRGGAVAQMPKRSGQKRDLRRPRWLAVLLLLAVVAATIYVVTGRTPAIAVPGVTNMSEADATAALTARGFKVTTQTQFSATVTAGNVISQVPKEGVKAAKGSTVTLLISQGPVTTSVLRVKGMLFSYAQQLLTAAGFKVVRQDQSSDTVKLNRVIDQDPSADAIVAKGTTITLIVSTGPALVAVPDVTKKSQADATNTLEAAGFVVTAKQAVSETVPQGNVISQNPVGGSKLAKGATITLTVSSGPPPVKVPNLLCMTRKQAQDALTHAGLKANFQGLSGDTKRVVDQDPVANASVPKGSTVNVVMGYGATC
ncbi:MAG TPA: Stk1 family PASTA domain-containing Ser/Thr kinase [Actinomycetota bacterium]|nr:Stk1 family PASTA domain-containing Ser/Thr kinase [Actinomycetota bacterium]